MVQCIQWCNVVTKEMFKIVYFIVKKETLKLKNKSQKAMDLSMFLENERKTNDGICIYDL